jgi:hypothetical protein
VSTPSSQPPSPTRHLLRHYVEMVVAMFVGMAVLALPARWATDAVGLDESSALMFLRMATTMTVPMVGWMLHRGHGWRANAEMSASMFVPTFAVIGLLWADVLTHIGLLMTIEHVAMLAAMAGVMLMRPAEYARHHARPSHVAPTGVERVTA